MLILFVILSFSCEEDIDECAVQPCKNGGICYNEIAKFMCECPEDFIGLTCEELKVKNCSNQMCLHGATCIDIPSKYQAHYTLKWFKSIVTLK